MAFEIPPWIKAPESVAKSYGTGFELGANVANQRAALQERAASEALWAQIAQQRAAQQQQYQQAQIAQDQQRLAQEQQLNQLKVQDTQRRFAAQQQYQADLAAGMDPLQAIMKNFPGTDESMTGYGQLARQLQLQNRMMRPPFPTSMTDPVTGERYGGYMTTTAEGERFTPFRQQADAMTRYMEEQELKELAKSRDAAVAAQNLYPGFQQKLDELRKMPKPDDAQKKALERMEDIDAAVKQADWEYRKRQHELRPQVYPDPGPAPRTGATAPGATVPGSIPIAAADGVPAGVMENTEDPLLTRVAKGIGGALGGAEAGLEGWMRGLQIPPNMMERVSQTWDAGEKRFEDIIRGKY